MAWKGTGGKHGGAEQADKNRKGNGSNAQDRGSINTIRGNGEVTTGGTTCRVGNETKWRPNIGSWDLCEFTKEERQNIETAEHVRKRDLDIVGIHESW